MGRFRKKERNHWATAQCCHPRWESDYPVSSAYIAAGLPLWKFYYLCYGGFLINQVLLGAFIGRKLYFLESDYSLG